MCKKLILGGLVGGVIFFVWSAVSWMFIPWHATTFSSFKDETAIKKVITDNIDKTGIYLLPSLESQDKQQMNAKIEPPIVFATVQVETPMSMQTKMGISFVIAFVTAFLLTWIAMQAVNAGYFKRVILVTTVALTASIMIYVPYWNWFGFSVNYTLVMIAEQLIGWYLAGFAIAKISMKN